MIQTFCEGPNNGGPSLAKFHEGPDPRTLAGSTPMVTSILVICSDKQFSFQIVTERGCKMAARSGARREFQADGPATVKLRGPYWSVLLSGTARSPRAAERR